MWTLARPGPGPSSRKNKVVGVRRASPFSFPFCSGLPRLSTADPPSDGTLDLFVYLQQGSHRSPVALRQDQTRVRSGPFISGLITMAQIAVDEESVHIMDLEVPIKDVAAYLNSGSESDRVNRLLRSLEVGARFLRRAGSAQDTRRRIVRWP